ncbi:hypothetical protein Tco_0752116 [Tanacetum coccineum]|uniref:Uncharacterized protein n=1 Tax=Tanacetum coccineum TaxID=301880 RepID=A0ABQ4Z625_9ASTR
MLVVKSGRSLMYLTSSRPDLVQQFAIVARYQHGTISKAPQGAFQRLIMPGLDSRKSTSGGYSSLVIKRVSWMLKNKTSLANVFSKRQPVFNDEYDTPSHTKKVFANMRRQGKDFSGTVTPLFATMLIQPQADAGEDETVYEEKGDSVERAATTAASLNAE